MIAFLLSFWKNVNNSLVTTQPANLLWALPSLSFHFVFIFFELPANMSNYIVPCVGPEMFAAFVIVYIQNKSVGDPWHFGADPDPDPRIRTSDKWIQLRIRLLSSLTLRMQKKNIFFIFFLITCLQAHHLQSEKFIFG